MLHGRKAIKQRHVVVKADLGKPQCIAWVGFCCFFLVSLLHKMQKKKKRKDSALGFSLYVAMRTATDRWQFEKSIQSLFYKKV